MRYELTTYEGAAVRPLLPNKPRGVPRPNDRRVRDGIFWVLVGFTGVRSAGEFRPLYNLL
jgi:transposase